MIVSAYFRIPSKKSHEFYMENIKRFLRNVSTPIVFFTTPDFVDELANMRPIEYPITFSTYESIYEIEAFKKYGFSFWKHHSDLDGGPTRGNLTSPELAAIWYNKKEFILRAYEITQSDEQYIWCDAGCIRTDAWLPYIRNFGTKLDVGDKLAFQLLRELPSTPQLLTWPSLNIAGAIIAGRIESWKTCGALYDEILKKYDEKNIPAASDQYVWGSTITFWSDSFLTIKPVYSPDEWFFFLKMM